MPTRNPTHFYKININMHHFPEYRESFQLIVSSHKESVSIALKGSDGSVPDRVYVLSKGGSLDFQDHKLQYKRDENIGAYIHFLDDVRVKIQKMVETIPCPRDADPQCWCAEILHALNEDKLVKIKFLNGPKPAPDTWCGHLIRLRCP
ncbi:hypothetical protein A9K55_001947 [Cordyceps militaris]|uniref:Uncharacterized protein n=1 Tax=Cordyceps militaris TaxID=73501 RepID=A0A2H4SQY1_CORMI|nr:hypothetical protein A9K55_001947 [Cordyceps militaris]